MKEFAKKMDQFTRESGYFDFPGFKLQAFLEGDKIADVSVGKTYTYYDLASLTKIIFTTTYFMDAVDSKKLSLSQKVSTLLPWYQHKGVKVSELLNHSAGNQWWQPFYKKIDSKLGPDQAFQQIEKFCQAAPLSQSKRAVYSDLDFYLLGSIMQKVEQRPLIDIWASIKEKYYSSTRLHFNYQNQLNYKKSLYAPTEKCSWRKKILTGEVHDENGWALGGIAPHAGVFGRIQDLSSFGLLLRQSYFDEKALFVSSKTLRKFTKRSLPQARGDWGFGFMIPSEKGSSAGELFHKNSFGHTGFTGTSLWFDPGRDLLVCLVSNRVHPSRKRRGFVSLRPRLHDLIVEYVEGKK